MNSQYKSIPIITHFTCLLAVLPAPRTVQKCRNLDTWLAAWNTFIRATLLFHPHLAQPMLFYQNAICQFAAQYEFNA